MDLREEIIGAIQTTVDTTIQETCPVITFGIVTSIKSSNKCVLSINNVDTTLSYYGTTAPIINRKYPVFIPSGKMSLAFIITGGEGGGSGTTDYNSLINKPSINGTSLNGNQTTQSLDLSTIQYNTTAGWNSSPSLKSKSNTVYVYTDYYDLDDGEKFPAVKIGDGNAYVIDLPFIEDGIERLLRNHISDNVVHITNSERTSWNNKVTCYLSGTDNLVFTKD